MSWPCFLDHSLRRWASLVLSIFSLPPFCSSLLCFKYSPYVHCIYFFNSRELHAMIQLWDPVVVCTVLLVPTISWQRSRCAVTPSRADPHSGLPRTGTTTISSKVNTPLYKNYTDNCSGKVHVYTMYMYM